MISNLPVELSLSIIAYLPIHSICSLQLTCRALNHTIKTNESQIYHAAAVNMGWIPSNCTLENLSSVHSFSGIQDWKSLCKRRLQIEKSWSGEGYSNLIAYTATGTSVHRFKVDEKAGIIVLTTRDNGVKVVDLRENKLLWSLPNDYVRDYAHCEYEKGFLIFDRLDRGKEVWRLASDYPPDDDHQKVKYPPRPDQIIASDLAFARHSDTYPHGHFKPWALFIMPRPTRAFRFVYPTLLVGSTNDFFLWDINSRDLVQTISSTENNSSLPTTLTHQHITHLHYVEVNARNVFVCTLASLMVFSRSDGHCVLDLPSIRKSYGSRMYTLEDKVPPPPGIETVLVNHPLSEKVLVAPSEPYRRYIDEFIAVHASSCGKHLIALLASSRLVVIRNFEQGETNLTQRMFQINVGSPTAPAKYLSFEGNKVAVATTHGIFILNLRQALSEEHSVKDELILTRVPALHNPLLLNSISCLHLTESGVFFNWDPNMLPFSSRNTRNDGDDSDDDDEDEGMRVSEEMFSQWLKTPPRHTRLPTGDMMVTLEPELPFASRVSTVCSVNFVPNQNQNRNRNGDTETRDENHLLSL